LNIYSEILAKTEESYIKKEEVSTIPNISSVSQEKVVSHGKTTEEMKEESNTKSGGEVKEDKQMTIVRKENQQAITTGKATLATLLTPILDFVFATFNLLFRVVALLIGYSSL